MASHELSDLGLLGADHLSLRLQLIGISTLRHLWLVVGVTDPLGGKAGCALDPLAERGEPVEDFVGLVEGRQVFTQRLLQIGLLLSQALELALHLGSPGHQDGLVGDLLGERRLGGGEVISEESRLGISSFGLHRRSLAGDLGLATQGLELASDLGEQIRQPGEIALS